MYYCKQLTGFHSYLPRNRLLMPKKAMHGGAGGFSARHTVGKNSVKK